MKINQDYLKNLLETFENSPIPTINIEQLQESGIDYNNDLFIFHMRILDDKGLIEREDGDPGFGLYSSIDGINTWSVLPLRLTADGHEFIEAIRNKEVWSIIKKDFKEASIDTLWNVSKSLLENYTKKKLELLLSPGA